MNKPLCGALLSVLMGCACASASESTPVVSPAPPSSADRAWMKTQQDELAQFKNSLQGQTYALPPAQQRSVDQLSEGLRQQQAQREDAAEKTPPALYFVSFSIPKDGLQAMLDEAASLKVTATIRGLIDNDFRKTAGQMLEFSKQNNKIGVQIDPMVFKQFNIQAVPALVVTCPGHYDVISGNIRIRDALRRVAREGDCAATAKNLLGGDL